MNSIKLFAKFVSESYQDVLVNFPLFLSSYIAFFLVDLFASIPWRGLGYGENSFWEILCSVIVAIFNLVVVVNVIMIEKSRVQLREKEKLIYTAPTYLIYTLYSSLIILAGLFCFVIPGIIAAIFLAMVPLASVLIDNDSINYFKVSYRMTKLDPLLIICFGLATFLVELPGFALDFIPEWRVELFLNFLYSFFDAFLMIVLTLSSVRIFYHLKRLLKDQSE